MLYPDRSQFSSDRAMQEQERRRRVEHDIPEAAREAALAREASGGTRRSNRVWMTLLGALVVAVIIVGILFVLTHR